ncbi:hypothetical protein F0562_019037 [Nyssa sinensis]|uniref:Palmitoyl-protein thioesterase 1 n=1 Tax=Nyssa sinensis TaxID=561372 RepID=A0A5J4ZED3_9ASTE|nr:hypothetical protein F0562_019037 [Nyssa sinensis]
MDSKPLPSFFIISIFIFTLTCIPTAYSLPFIVFHGFADTCSSLGVAHFTKLLSNWSGSQGYCIAVGDDTMDSWFVPLLEQTAFACEKVKKMSELSEGYNIVGLSQGNMVGRGVLEFCDGGPPVKNFISLAGPHAGQASVPLCGSGLWCILVDYLIEFAIYSSYIQEHLAPAGYVKIPTDYQDYIQGCKFLTKLNNEVSDHMNTTYKERFTSLENLVLIMFEQDKVLIPKETSWFGYYPKGSWSTVLPAQETPLYSEDWIGLRTLDKAGKVKFINVSGSHLQISQSDMKKYILPYLKDKSAKQPTITESSLKWSSSIWNFIKELVGLTKDGPMLYSPS